MLVVSVAILDARKKRVFTVRPQQVYVLDHRAPSPMDPKQINSPANVEIYRALAKRV